MSNPTRKAAAGVTAVWGVSGIAPDTYGIVHSVTRKNSATKEPIKNVVGNTVGFTLSDEIIEFTVEVLVKSGMTNPAIGNTLTIDSLSAYIENWELKWEHAGHKMLSISCTRYVDGAIP